ncbi:MAG: M20 family metallopeptidase [Phycisphaerae bacterium]|nr:M20 family metallopeptidase [Phycisphaerae bacterium]MDW8262624.1 M20 family metallopeptidase [Phycisphaerales bacterium]
MTVDTEVESVLPAVVDLRHRLHRIPELAFEEFKTAETLRAELKSLGIPFIAGVSEAPTATIAWLGDPSRPCIALRADIDGLPIVEQTQLPYASTHPGKMHACGHDGHSATLMGVAAVLRRIEKSLAVCVKLIWQPAEESGGGAEVLCRAGVLDGRIGPRVSAIFGLHGWPGLPAGVVSTRPGPLLASTDTFTATFVGRGCHGAFPHLGRDPIVTACEAVLNLQAFVSREVDPTDSVVVTVGKIIGGTATNIIPDRVTIEGTMRALTGDTRAALRAGVQRRCAGVAAAHDCELHFILEPGYPSTVNDPVQAAYVERVARQTLGSDRYLPAARPVMGGEDFAYYLEKVPGAFFLVGTIPPGQKSYPSLHNDRYDFTDAALAVGMRMFLGLVTEWKPS